MTWFILIFFLQAALKSPFTRKLFISLLFVFSEAFCLLLPLATSWWFLVEPGWSISSGLRVESPMPPAHRLPGTEDSMVVSQILTMASTMALQTTPQRYTAKHFPLQCRCIFNRAKVQSGIQTTEILHCSCHAFGALLDLVFDRATSWWSLSRGPTWMLGPTVSKRFSAS